MQKFNPINQQNNYFTSMIRKYDGNENFVSFLKPEQIQRAAKERIFREMAKGQIDYQQFGKYFEDPKFIDNLLVAAGDELNNNETVNRALEFYDLNFPGDGNVIYNRMKYSALICIFKVLNTRLYNARNTGNIGYLTDIQFVLTVDQVKFM